MRDYSKEKEIEKALIEKNFESSEDGFNLWGDGFFPKELLEIRKG